MATRTSYPIKVVSSITLQSSLTQVANFLTNAVTGLPKYLPNIYSSIVVKDRGQDFIKGFQVNYARGLPIVWSNVNVGAIDTVNSVATYRVNILTNGNAGNFNTEGTIIQAIAVVRAVDGNRTKIEITYEFERNNTDIGPAFFEFELSNFINWDKVIQAQAQAP